MADTIVVYSYDVTTDRGPYPHTSSSGPTYISIEQQPPSGESRSNSGCLEGVREQDFTSEISGKAKQLLNKCRRDSSKATYEVPWRKWLSWCDGRQVDPLQASLVNVVDFLAEGFYDEDNP